MAGRTLIELIIAIAIGMVIMIGVGSLYLSSSGVSRMAQQAGSAEESSRLLMGLIGEGIKAGGYGEIVGTGDVRAGQTLFDGATVRGCSGSRFTAAFNATPDFTCTGVAPGDQLLVRFQSRYAAADMSDPNRDNTALRDCLGISSPGQDSVSTGAYAGVTRRLVQDVFALNPAGTTLRCEANGNPGFPTPIVNDVIDFRVFYKFDDRGFAMGINGSPAGGSIRDATWINAQAGGADPWNYVVSVIVCLTVASRELGTSLQSTTTQAPRCPNTTAEAAQGTAIMDNANDGRIRRTFLQTFTIRSQATHNSAFDI